MKRSREKGRTLTFNNSSESQQRGRQRKGRGLEGGRGVSVGGRRGGGTGGEGGGRDGRRRRRGYTTRALGSGCDLAEDERVRSSSSPREAAGNRYRRHGCRGRGDARSPGAATSASAASKTRVPRRRRRRRRRRAGGPRADAVNGVLYDGRRRGRRGPWGQAPLRSVGSLRRRQVTNLLNFHVINQRDRWAG